MARLATSTRSGICAAGIAASLDSLHLHVARVHDLISDTVEHAWRNALPRQRSEIMLSRTPPKPSLVRLHRGVGSTGALHKSGAKISSNRALQRKKTVEMNRGMGEKETAAIAIQRVARAVQRERVEAAERKRRGEFEVRRARRASREVPHMREVES